MALWLENQDQFIHGNMNGLQIGSSLSLVNLENRLANMDLKTAQELLASQWKEWKVIRDKKNLPGKLETQYSVDEDALPSEQNQNLAQIFELLSGWRKSWEEGDLDKHMLHFSKGSPDQETSAFSKMKSFKKRMFVQNKSVQLHAFHPVLVQLMDRPMVTFEQTFSSQKMESLGRKDIQLTWDGLEWKIISESFRVKEFREKKSGSPFSAAPVEASGFHPETAGAPSAFVLHVSSHIDLPTATRVVNQLRKKGLSAYSCPLFISAKQKIYRVYVGRWPDWELAGKITSQVKRMESGRFAVSISAPYTLEAGAYRSEKEANEQIKFLRSQNFSPFLFVTGEKDFLEQHYRVLIGAFTSRSQAQTLSSILKEVGIATAMISP